MNTGELIKTFKASDEQKKEQMLMGCEHLANSELIDFLIQVSGNVKEADLVRTGVIKALGLSGLKIESQARVIIEHLLDLAKHDADDDVRAYALQLLCWYSLAKNDFEEIAGMASDEDEEELIRENYFAVITSKKSDAALKAVALKQLISDPLFGKSAKRELGI